MSRDIDWDLVQDRLSDLPAIASSFPIEMLRSCEEVQPYHCHYMAWRLVHLHLAQLGRIDELIAMGASFDGWKFERNLLSDPDFAAFWSFLWQLQVAEFLASRKYRVSWQKSGPDLVAKGADQLVFVECYCYRKSFGVYLFLEEALRAIHPQLRITRQSFLPFTLPHDRLGVSALLDECLEPLLEDAYLAAKLEETTRRWPVVLRPATERGKFVIYLEGDLAKYDPSVLPQGHGEPSGTLATALREVVNAKSGSNSLSNNHPNLVAANFLVNPDVQVASWVRVAPAISLPDSIDALGYGAVGIDDTITAERMSLVARPGHPAESWGWQ